MVDIIFVCDKGLIFIVIVDLWLFNFKWWNSVLFINVELNVVMVLIVIGIFVKFNNVVNVIEFNGVVLIIVIILFKMIFMIIGFVFVLFWIILLIWINVLFIIGVNNIVIRWVNGVKMIIDLIKLILFGIYFFVYFIIYLII